MAPLPNCFHFFLPLLLSPWSFINAAFTVWLTDVLSLSVPLWTQVYSWGVNLKFQSGSQKYHGIRIALLIFLKQNSRIRIVSFNKYWKNNVLEKHRHGIWQYRVFCPYGRVRTAALAKSSRTEFWRGSESFNKYRNHFHFQRMSRIHLWLENK